MLVTGGGTGLGKEVAVYSHLGAHVTIASRKEEVLKKLLIK